MGSEVSVLDKVKKSVLEHQVQYEVAGATLAAGALMLASRGESANFVRAGESIAQYLPELKIFSDVAAKSAPRMATVAEEVLTATRPQTLIEKFTEKSLRMSVGSAKTVLTALRGAETPVTLTRDAASLPSDEVRKHVFNRFLARMSQGDYILHGSYALENQIGVGARKAVNDLDILSTSAAVAKGKPKEITEALIADMQKAADNDMGDGLKFTIKPTDTISDRLFPRMRHLVATAESQGQEVMRIPLDVRVGAQTILPPEQMTLSNVFNGVEYTNSVQSMAKEETLAYKLFTYGNRYVGGLVRKQKDIGDMAALINSGVDDGKATEALQAWTSRGFGMAPIRPVSEILGSEFSQPTAVQRQLADSFRTVKSFYQGIGKEVEDVPLRPEVSDSWLAQSTRFLKKHYVIYPAEIKPAVGN